MQNKQRSLPRAVSLLLCIVLLLTLFSACGSVPDSTEVTETEADISAQNTDESSTPETVTLTDSAGREVVLPAELTCVAPSGPVAQMILLTLAPELLAGLSDHLTEEKLPWFPNYVADLPVFGQLYSGKSDLNMEALLASDAQAVIDLGDFKESTAEDMESIEAQTGLPAVFLDASLEALPETYRTLGRLLNREEQAEKLAQFVEKTLALTEENAAKIPEDERLTVYYGIGDSGLNCNAAGSVQADVIELIGAQNAVIPEEINNKSGGTIVSLEELYACEPDVILLGSGGPYDSLTDGEWAELQAVRNGSFYEIPDTPYNWMSGPPSVNRVLGIWWLGNLLYPELYDYDIVAVAQEYYELFLHYDLSTEEAEALLARSTLK